MAKLKNIQKVAQILGGEVDSLSDSDTAFIRLENKEWAIEICFDGKGEKFDYILFAEKIYQVVDEKVVATIRKD